MEQLHVFLASVHRTVEHGNRIIADNSATSALTFAVLFFSALSFSGVFKGFTSIYSIHQKFVAESKAIEKKKRELGETKQRRWYESEDSDSDDDEDEEGSEKKEPSVEGGGSAAKPSTTTTTATTTTTTTTTASTATTTDTTTTTPPSATTKTKKKKLTWLQKKRKSFQQLLESMSSETTVELLKEVFQYKIHLIVWGFVFQLVHMGLKIAAIGPASKLQTLVYRELERALLEAASTIMVNNSSDSNSSTIIGNDTLTAALSSSFSNLNMVTNESTSMMMMMMNTTTNVSSSVFSVIFAYLPTTVSSFLTIQDPRVLSIVTTLWGLILWQMYYLVMCTFCKAATSRLFNAAQAGMSITRRRRFLRSILIQDKAFHSAKGAQLSFRTITDADAVDELLLRLIPDLVERILSFLVGVIGCFIIDWQVLVVTLILHSPFYGGFYMHMYQSTTCYETVQEERQEELRTTVSEAFTNIDLVQMSAAEELTVRDAEQHNLKVHDANVSIQWPETLVELSSRVMHSGTQSLQTSFAVYRALTRTPRFTVGDWVSFGYYELNMDNNIHRINYLSTRIVQAYKKVQRYFKLRSRKPLIDLHMRAENMALSSPSAASSSGAGEDGGNVGLAATISLGPSCSHEEENDSENAEKQTSVVNAKKGEGKRGKKAATTTSGTNAASSSPSSSSSSAAAAAAAAAVVVSVPVVRPQHPTSTALPLQGVAFMPSILRSSSALDADDGEQYPILDYDDAEMEDVSPTESSSSSSSSSALSSVVNTKSVAYRRKNATPAATTAKETSNAAASTVTTTTTTTTTKPPLYCVVHVNGKLHRRIPKGQISFKNVEFSYPEVEVDEEEAKKAAKLAAKKAKEAALQVTDDDADAAAGKAAEAATTTTTSTSGATAPEEKNKKEEDTVSTNPEASTTSDSTETTKAPADKRVLKGLTYSIPAGTLVALVGCSGSGKSTIFRLLTRMFDPNKGSISLDGYDLKDYAPRSLRRCIGYVQQNPSLLSKTVRENILFGFDPQSPSCPTEQDMIRAATMANIHSTIVNKLPKGYDTKLDTDRLSGGQKQRIAIARAVVHDPAILLLDEATSALDPPSEGAVTAALQASMKGRTTFVIAHRLSTVVNADVILLLEDGVIVEAGTHKDLLAAKGKYAAFVEPQLMDAAGNTGTSAAAVTTTTTSGGGEGGAEAAANALKKVTVVKEGMELRA